MTQAKPEKPKRPVHPWIRAGLEFGPILGFVVTYLIYKDETFRIAGRDYSGFVAVTAMFLPLFLLSTGLLWHLTGRLRRIQAVTTGMLILFGGLGVWMNDPQLIKMKPTAIYLLLALILTVGLLRGQSWLKFVMEGMVPLMDKGWMILTRRVTVFFYLSALANEVVWRTQSETFWVYFETLAMPVIVLVFFLGQINLYVEYVTLPPVKQKPGQGKRRRAQVKRAQAQAGQSPKDQAPGL